MEKADLIEQTKRVFNIHPDHKAQTISEVIRMRKNMSCQHRAIALASLASVFADFIDQEIE